jgi:di/tricarboxylate transporter
MVLQHSQITLKMFKTGITSRFWAAVGLTNAMQKHNIFWDLAGNKC